MEELVKFVEWTKLKIKIHLKEIGGKFYYHEREIWWASLGVNIGFEQDGKNDNFERPVLIIKKFNKDILWILPITSKVKTNKYYHSFKRDDNYYTIILSQLKMISSKRLLRKIGTLPKEEYFQVINKIKDFLKT